MRSGRIALGLSIAAFVAFGPLAMPKAYAQDCVRTVRALSDFTIHGDAWTWWKHAEGQYDRSKRPAPGSVLVFKRTGHLHRGHVSLVSHIIDRRTIEVDHTWIDGDGIKRNMRVVDVSRNNDWTAVRVWYEPGEQLGMRVYATYGFIMPEGERAPRGGVMEARDSGIGDDFSVSPSGRGGRHGGRQERIFAVSAPSHAVVPGRKPRVIEASYTPAPAQSNSAEVRTASASFVPAVAVVLPPRKPTTVVASATPADPARVPDTLVAGIDPGRKPVLPGSRSEVKAEPTQVASIAGRRTVLPPHKPGSVDVAELIRE